MKLQFALKSMNFFRYRDNESTVVISNPNLVDALKPEAIESLCATESEMCINFQN